MHQDTFYFEEKDSETDPPHVEMYKNSHQYFRTCWLIHFDQSCDEYPSPNFKIFVHNLKFKLLFEYGKLYLYGYKIHQSSIQAYKYFANIINLKDEGDVSKCTKGIFRFFSDECQNNQFLAISKDQMVNDGLWLTVNSELKINLEICLYDQAPQFTIQTRSLLLHGQTPGHIGITNAGSTCYMNSFLQILFHLPIFRSIIYQASSEGENSVCLQLQRLFYMMQTSNHPCSTEDFRKCLQFFGWNANNQQDALEFGNRLIDILSKEIGEASKTKIDKLFQGFQEDIIESTSSQYKSSTKETFFQLLMDVEQNDKLFKSIKQYLKTDIISYQTPEGIPLEVKKSVKFVSFPPVLMFSLKRYGYRNYRPIKVTSKLEFRDTIYLDQFTRDDNDVFLLYAVLVHEGPHITAGHYCSYIRDFDTDEWKQYNDSGVSQVNESQAINDNYDGNQCAYLLVYIRSSEQDTIFAKIPEESIPQHLKDFYQVQKSLYENYTFNFILEDDLNQIDSIDSPFPRSPHTVTIKKSNTIESLYHEVAARFKKNEDQLLLWNTDQGVPVMIYPKSTNILEQTFINSDRLFFVQNVTEIGANDQITLFVQYFDTRMKLPLTYIGSIHVNPNDYLATLSLKILPMLDFPENTKLLYFKYDSTCQRARPAIIDNTYSSAKFAHGNFMVVQADPNFPLPDLSQSTTFQNVELALNPEIPEQPNQDDNIVRMYDEFPQLKTGHFDYYLDSHYHMTKIDVYDISNQARPLFCFEFPDSASLASLHHIIMQREQYKKTDSLIYFQYDHYSQMPSTTFYANLNKLIAELSKQKIYFKKINPISLSTTNLKSYCNLKISTNRRTVDIDEYFAVPKSATPFELFKSLVMFPGAETPNTIEVAGGKSVSETLNSFVNPEVSNLSAKEIFENNKNISNEMIQTLYFPMYAFKIVKSSCTELQLHCSVTTDGTVIRINRSQLKP